MALQSLAIHDFWHAAVVRDQGILAIRRRPHPSYARSAIEVAPNRCPDSCIEWALSLQKLVLRFIKCILPDGRLYIANNVVANLPSVVARMWFYRKIMGFHIAPTATIFLGTRFHCAGGLSIGDISVVNENLPSRSEGSTDYRKRQYIDG